MKKDQNKQAEAELSHIFQQVRQALDINQSQNKQKLMFDYLVAIESATKLINKAWKVGSIYKITDNKLQQDFTRMLVSFERMKKKLRQEIPLH